MTKDHYVSQLIIRRFSKAINVFDVEQKKLMKEKSPASVFHEKNKYSSDVEKRMAQELEDPFAKLIDKKILEKDEIILTRDELLLIKRFLLINSIRTFSSDDFYEIISDFKGPAERYILANKSISVIDESGLPSISEKTESKRALHMQAMKMFLDCSAAPDMLKHEYVTKELYCWAKTFLDSFLVFWDADERQEFILTDNGMTTEYEPSHTIFEGMDISKLSYLLYHFRNSDDKLKGVVYADLLSKHQIMYENFNIFPLSSTRCIVHVNPFFRLYSGIPRKFIGSSREIMLDIPDIWPTCIETKESITVPKNNYSYGNLSNSDNDLFTYSACKLSLFDTIYINNLALNQKKKFIGFNDINKVIDSLYCAIAMNAVNKREIYEGSEAENLTKMIEHLVKDEYNYIFQQYPDLQTIFLMNPFEFLEIYGDRSWKDIKENKYLLEFLLSDEEKIKAMDNFAFMGDSEQRIQAFKSFLKGIKQTGSQE